MGSQYILQRRTAVATPPRLLLHLRDPLAAADPAVEEEGIVEGGTSRDINLVSGRRGRLTGDSLFGYWGEESNARHLDIEPGPGAGLQAFVEGIFSLKRTRARVRHGSISGEPGRRGVESKSGGEEEEELEGEMSCVRVSWRYLTGILILILYSMLNKLG